MRKGLSILIGLLLILAAFAGLVICIGGIVGVWQFRQVLTQSITNTVDLLETALNATADGLDVASESLVKASDSVNVLADTIQTTGKSISDTLPLVDTFIKISSEDLPKMIETSQKALGAAQASATVVDSTLGVLTAIPFLPIQPYRPEVPLGKALGEVSTSLDPLPRALVSMKDSLTTTRGNLEHVSEQIGTIAKSVSDINNSLEDANVVLGQYKGVVSTLQEQLTLAKNGLPAYIRIMAWVVTVVLVWLGLTQIGLMMQGFEMLGMQLLREKPPERPESA